MYFHWNLNLVDVLLLFTLFLTVHNQNCGRGNTRSLSNNPATDTNLFSMKKLPQRSYISPALQQLHLPVATTQTACLHRAVCSKAAYRQICLFSLHVLSYFLCTCSCSVTHPFMSPAQHSSPSPCIIWLGYLTYPTLPLIPTLQFHLLVKQQGVKNKCFSWYLYCISYFSFEKWKFSFSLLTGLWKSNVRLISE